MNIIKKIGFIICFILIAIVAIVMFVLIPTADSLKKHQKELSVQESELNKSYEKLDALQKISKQPDDFQKKLSVVNNYWPDELDVANFIVQSEELAKRNSLVIENFSVDELKTQSAAASAPAKNDDDSEAKKTANKKASPKGTQFSLSAKASYSSIFQLIKDYESLPRLNTISSINLNGTDENVTARITGNIYYGK